MPKRRRSVAEMEREAMSERPAQEVTMQVMSDPARARSLPWWRFWVRIVSARRVLAKRDLSRGGASRLRPELRKAFEESWKENEAVYRSVSRK